MSLYHLLEVGEDVHRGVWSLLSQSEFALHANSGAVAISSSQQKRRRRQSRAAEGRERRGGKEEENLVNDCRGKKR